MKKSSILIFLLTGFLALASLLSCKAKTINTSEKVNIICTIFPEYDWAKSIIGDADPDTTLTLLVKNGVDLHSYQPSAADIVQISTCDLFVYVGGESDAWVKAALENARNKDMKILNLMEILQENVKEEEIIEGMQEEAHHHEDFTPRKDTDEAGSVIAGDSGNSDSAQENAYPLDGDPRPNEANPHSDAPEYDEHVWLSLKNAKIICQEFTKILCQLLPQNAEKYQANLEAYIEQLDSLDLSFASVIAGAPNKTIIVCDRFPFRYLADDYNLKYYAAFSGCSAETEASFETVAFLANKLKEENLPAVFVLDQSNQKIAKTVILNAKLPHTDILQLDSMQSTSLRQSFNGKTYIKTMQENLENLQKGLQKK